MAIERVRTVVTATGERSTSDDVIHLDKVDAAQVEAEALRPGCGRARRASSRRPTSTSGTTVVMLRG